MASDNRVHMPSSMGGLVRYFDEYKSKFEIKPGHVIILVILFIILEIILHWQGYSILGL